MISVRHGTLVADTVTTISVTANTNACIVAQDYLTNTETHRWGDNFSEVEVVNVDGDDEIYFRADGTNPTVAGNDSHVLPAAAGASLKIPIGRTVTGQVKLISNGTPAYSVELR